jgi:hypothetical protein
MLLVVKFKYVHCQMSAINDGIPVHVSFLGGGAVVHTSVLEVHTASILRLEVTICFSVTLLST